MENTDL